MTCEEFRSVYNRWLDLHASPGPPEDALLHLQVCGPCGRYAAAMRRIDAGLREIPRVEIPVDYLAPGVYIEESPASRPRPVSRRRRLVEAGAIALPVAAAWSAGILLPPAWSPACQFVLATAGLVMVLVASLGPAYSR